MIFDIKGWTKIVAFHTRNVPHRGHEHVIAHACERCNADGILIHPVIGPKKPGDFSPQAVLGAYERLIPAGRTQRACWRRSALTPALRPARGGVHGALPEEFRLHALRARPRSHGRRRLLPRHQNRDLVDSLGDIGITPVFFDSVYFSETDGATVECPTKSPSSARFPVPDSPASRREAKCAPHGACRDELSNWLNDQQAAGVPCSL